MLVFGSESFRRRGRNAKLGIRTLSAGEVVGGWGYWLRAYGERPVRHLDLKIHGPVATIMIDRVTVRNALNRELLDEMQVAFSDVHQEKRVRAVILSGAGDQFCSGVDLRALGEITRLPPTESLAAVHDYWRRLTELFEQMLRFPKPIIAAVDGSAVGAGFGLALAADMIVGSTRAVFTADATRRGLVGGGTAALLAFRLGAGVAARMLLAGEPLDAAAANHAGLLVGPPVAPEQIWVKSNEVGLRCAESSAEAIQATKRVLNESVGEQLMSQLASGAAGSATACTTEAAMEGMQAFSEGRDPQWP